MVLSPDIFYQCSTTLALLFDAARISRVTGTGLVDSSTLLGQRTRLMPHALYYWGPLLPLRARDLSGCPGVVHGEPIVVQHPSNSSNNSKQPPQETQASQQQMPHRGTPKLHYVQVMFFIGLILQKGIASSPKGLCITYRKH